MTLGEFELIGTILEALSDTISGEGVVIEGATFATGHTVIHWLTPAPRGSIAFFDAFDDFLKIHIKPHPTNKTIITFEDGEQTIYDGG